MIYTSCTGLDGVGNVCCGLKDQKLGCMYIVHSYADLGYFYGARVSLHSVNYTTVIDLGFKMSDHYFYDYISAPVQLFVFHGKGSITNLIIIFTIVFLHLSSYLCVHGKGSITNIVGF